MTLRDSPLGKQTAYVSQYDPELLHPIPRLSNRQALGLGQGELPFVGEDIWNGYELSWLNTRGKPEVAMAEFRIPCDSPCIIESKSFKLYLNSFNQTRFDSWSQVEDLLRRDLGAALGNGAIEVTLMPARGPVRVPEDASSDWLEAECIDDQDLDIQVYHPDASLLTTVEGEPVSESLVSHLLKSNCPVTGQPDWASVLIRYEGAPIDRAGLLRYLVSFREHQDFHEHCVERIFCDILSRCRPSRLLVQARYTRRGGLDINPVRSTHPVRVANPRLARQ